jgi:O-glycosyl hydrolase
MNEPRYTFDGCGQEGMAVPAVQRAAVIQALGRQLAARAPYCRISADESSRVGQHFLEDVPRWLSVPGTAEHVASLAHHLYDFPDAATLSRARALAEAYNKPLWSTEICCIDTSSDSFGQQFDPTIESGIIMAKRIWQGMIHANDSAFHWWVACSSELGCDPVHEPWGPAQVNPDGWNDGLLYYDPNYAQNGNQLIYVTKRYHALGHFSRYVRPGAVRHDITGVPDNLYVAAFATAAGVLPGDPPPRQPALLSGALPTATPDARWTLVIINDAPAGARPITLRVQMPVAAPLRLLPVNAVETTATRELEPAPMPAVTDTGLLTARIPPQSITTYVLQYDIAIAP